MIASLVGGRAYTVMEQKASSRCNRGIVDEFSFVNEPLSSANSLQVSL